MFDGVSDVCLVTAVLMPHARYSTRGGLNVSVSRCLGAICVALRSAREMQVLPMHRCVFLHCCCRNCQTAVAWVEDWGSDFSVPVVGEMIALSDTHD